MANSVFLYWIGSLPVSVSGSTLTITGNVATNALLLDAANQDIHIYRSGAKALAIDADGAGGALNSMTVNGPFNVNSGDVTIGTTGALIIRSTGSQIYSPSTNNLAFYTNGALRGN